jgi:rubrerythrin
LIFLKNAAGGRPYSRSMEPIRSAAELYAHAIAIEREATERYVEFAQRMNDLGDEAVAAVFTRLARLEEEHLGALERRTAGLALPPLETHDYRWLDAGAPETAARELVYRRPSSSTCSRARRIPRCARWRARWRPTSASTSP